MPNEVKIVVTAQDKTKGTFTNLKSGLAAVAKGAAVMGGLVLAGSIKAIKGASDLSETINKSSIIFGANAKAMDTWAKKAATNLGLSRQEALEAAAGFGDMFLQLGFAGNKADDMARSVVELSADLGSFNNLPTADVSERIAAAFRGEYDSLQQLIPNINAARVEKEAMAKTGKKNADALTAEEKAAAVLAIVTKDGERAAGDFKETQDGLANSLKTVKARLKDARDNFGTLIEPAAKRAIQWFIDEGLPALEGFVEKVAKDKDIKRSVKELGDALAAFTDKDLAGTLDDIATQLPPVIDGFTQVVTKAKQLSDIIEGFEEATGKEEGGPLGGMANAVARNIRKIGNSIQDGWNKMTDWVVEKSGELRDKVVDKFKELGSAISQESRKPGRAIETAWNKMTDWVVTKTKSLVNRVVDWFKGLPGKAKSALSSLSSKIGAEVEQAKDNVLRKARDLVTRFTDRMQELVRKAKEQAGKVKGAITDKFANAKDWLYGKGKAVINGLLDGLKAPYQKLKDWVSGIATWIKDHKGPISLDRELLKPAGKALMGGLLEGLKVGFGGVGDFVYGAGTSIKDIIAKIKDTMFLGDWSGKIGSLAGGAGNKLLNAIRNTFGIGGGTYPGHGERGASKSWDFMARGALGNAIASFAKTFAKQLGVMYVIWNKRIWSVARASEGWRPYTRYGPGASASQLHTNHVHVSLFDKGGMLRGLGMNLSGQPERVLSPAQTRSFDRMVRVMDRGGGAAIGNTYIINAPNYVGDKKDLVKALTDLDRQGRLAVVRR